MAKVRLLVDLCVFCTSAYLHGLISWYSMHFSSLISIYIYENPSIDLSRSSSTKTGASRVAPMSAAVNALTCIPTSAAATP